MLEERQKYLVEYLGYLCANHSEYRKIGTATKWVTHFLENATELNKKGYRHYMDSYAAELANANGAKDAILEFLSFMGIGYRKIRRKIKPLEAKSVISVRNQQLVNEFTEWLSTERNLSARTTQTYSTGMRMFFRYADTFNAENAKRYLKTMEEKSQKPSSINNRMCAMISFSNFIKKPITLKRIKVQRRLSTDNIPTEREYLKLLEYLKSKPDHKYYLWMRILSTTGLRIHEFKKLTWENVLDGETVIKGKGSKCRQVFFQKNLQQEVREYVRATGATGLILRNMHGAPLSDRGFSGCLKDWGQHVGIDRCKMHAHAFRHFFAKQFLKKSKDITQLADLLGHARLDTTMIYLQKSHEEQKRDFNRNVTW